ncbi:MAG: DUF1684 domain-containing protein [Flavobacteriaceae bacterium]|nr:MAG: DUF1684 domain-containing protein [Flavobacteriaceae bacterium]
MEKRITILILFIFISCNSQDKKPVAGETEYQRELNAQYKDVTRSPLKKKDLKSFKGLDFFPVDSSFIVTAKLTLTPDTPVFEMPTTTDWKPLYREYGILHFSLKGRTFQLTLYQNQDELSDPKYRDYLFLPFTDGTSGEESYGGGRYMDVFLSTINEDGTVVLNFNNTYNPYCAYNENYSCPLTPRKNHLGIAIKAGVKVFKKDK